MDVIYVPVTPTGRQNIQTKRGLLIVDIIYVPVTPTGVAVVIALSFTFIHYMAEERLVGL